MRTLLIELIDCGRVSEKTNGLESGPHMENNFPPLTRWL